MRACDLYRSLACEDRNNHYLKTIESQKMIKRQKNLLKPSSLHAKKPYTWIDQNASINAIFNNATFKEGCCTLHDTPLTSVETFAELIKLSEKAKGNRNQTQRKQVLYSEETRKHRQRYKNLIRKYKENDSHENLVQLLKAKRSRIQQNVKIR